MAKFDPRFWEIPVDPASFDNLEAVLTSAGEQADKERRLDLIEETMELLRIIIRSRLTERQQQILTLYFFEERSEAEISALLGISQQVVSKHLFGVMRDGTKVGGALKKLRKAMQEHDIDPEKWV